MNPNPVGAASFAVGATNTCTMRLRKDSAFARALAIGVASCCARADGVSASAGARRKRRKAVIPRHLFHIIIDFDSAGSDPTSGPSTTATRGLS
jgi:hypothetical protein